jgi:hypothetical protein
LSPGEPKALSRPSSVRWITRCVCKSIVPA